MKSLSQKEKIMQYTFNKTTNLLAKGNCAKKECVVHPAEKTSKSAVYSKNYNSKKPCQVKQAGRTLAN